MTRPVTVFEYVVSAEANDTITKRVLSKGRFLEFGMDSEETEKGVMAFSTALVEIPNGEVLNICVQLIRFDDIN